LLSVSGLVCERTQDLAGWSKLKRGEEIKKGVGRLNFARGLCNRKITIQIGSSPAGRRGKFRAEVSAKKKFGRASLGGEGRQQGGETD